MARYIALEWDGREARVAIATTQGASVTVEDAFAIPLPNRAEDSADAESGVGQAIADALSAHKVGRGQGLVAIGRASIELKQLTLPPAPDEELPELARFQAMREFNSLGDDWTLDFLPMADAPDAPRQVLAAAISPEFLGQIRETLAIAKITPEHLALRPCAAASLLCRSSDSRDYRAKLLVDLLAEEADLTVLVEEQVVFLRTTRLPSDHSSDPESIRLLVGEIRRTIAAAQNQLGGEKVEAVYLCGAGAKLGALAARIEEGVGLPTRLFDPFAGRSVSGKLKSQPPVASGRFAPLLGMLLDQAYGGKHAIDFLNPRRRPDPPNRRRKGLLVAAAAATVLLCGLYWIWQELGKLDHEITELQESSKKHSKLVAKAKENESAAKEIGAWTSKDVSWLDELRELAIDMPSSEEVLLTRLTMSQHDDGGQIDLDGLARDATAAANLESKLRDEKHRVQGRGLTQDTSKENYGWKFTTSIVLATQDAEAYRKRGKEVEVTNVGGFPGGFPGGGFPGGGGGFPGGGGGFPGGFPGGGGGFPGGGGGGSSGGGGDDDGPPGAGGGRRRRSESADSNSAESSADRSSDTENNDGPPGSGGGRRKKKPESEAKPASEPEKSASSEDSSASGGSSAERRDPPAPANDDGPPGSGGGRRKKKPETEKQDSKTESETKASESQPEASPPPSDLPPGAGGGRRTKKKTESDAKESN